MKSPLNQNRCQNKRKGLMGKGIGWSQSKIQWMVDVEFVVCFIIYTSNRISILCILIRISIHFDMK